jgi:hypothetical protein
MKLIHRIIKNLNFIFKFFNKFFNININRSMFNMIRIIKYPSSKTIDKRYMMTIINIQIK